MTLQLFRFYYSTYFDCLAYVLYLSTRTVDLTSNKDEN